MNQSFNENIDASRFSKARASRVCLITVIAVVCIIRRIYLSTLVVALMLLAQINSAHAVSTCSNNINQDQRLNLPGALAALLPPTVGVESFSKASLKATQEMLVAAIILPAWYFSKDYCTDNQQNDHDAARILFVWRSSHGKWVKVSKSSRFTWQIATAGNADVNLESRPEGFVLYQNSSPVRANFYDDFEFRFDSRTLRMRLVRRDSGSTYCPMCTGGATPEMDKLYEQAIAEFGEVSDQEGFEATLDLLTGRGSVTEYVFARPSMQREIQSSTKPIYLEEISDKAFNELPFFKQSSSVANTNAVR